MLKSLEGELIDFVYIVSPGNAAIFRGECFSVAVEIKTSISDLYKYPLQILRYFGKTDYLFLCVPKAMKEDTLLLRALFARPMLPMMNFKPR